MQELEKILEEIDAHAIEFEIFGTSDDYISIGWVKDIIRKHMNDSQRKDTFEFDFTGVKSFNCQCGRHYVNTSDDGWVPVDKRLPDKEAEKFIKEKLDGIGYLYPCLLTYRSPNTERIHVVRFYYDVYERWFVNAGEELCEKDRCIAWRPLPEPYRPERSMN